MPWIFEKPQTSARTVNELKKERDIPFHESKEVIRRRLRSCVLTYEAFAVTAFASPSQVRFEYFDNIESPRARCALF
jgi:hypothetical protein